MLKLKKDTLLETERSFIVTKLFDGYISNDNERKAVERYINSYKEVLDRCFPGVDVIEIDKEMLSKVLGDFYSTVTYEDVTSALPKTAKLPTEEAVQDVRDYIYNINMLSEEEKEELTNNIVSDIRSLNSAEVLAHEYISIYVKYTSKHPKFLNSTTNMTYSRLKELADNELFLNK